MYIQRINTIKSHNHEQRNYHHDSLGSAEVELRWIKVEQGSKIQLHVITNKEFISVCNDMIDGFSVPIPPMIYPYPYPYP